MNRTLLAFLLIFAKFSYGQTSYFTFNNGTILTEKDLRAAFESVKKAIPPGYSLVPTIYHKVNKKDSVINYITFNAEKESGKENQDFKITFTQDSIFLFLNEKLPEFKLKDLKGKEFSLAQFKGKPMLINFWATYCIPCIAEMPALSKLKDKYGNEMHFLGLTENKSEEDNLIAFLEKHPFNYHIFQNVERYKEALKISALPRNIFVDKDGYIRYIQGNFPLKMTDASSEVKEHDENNYFVQIIEELKKKQ